MLVDFFFTKGFILGFLFKKKYYINNYFNNVVFYESVDFYRFTYTYSIFYRKSLKKVLFDVKPVQINSQKIFTLNWLRRKSMYNLIWLDPKLLGTSLNEVYDVFFLL